MLHVCCLKQKVTVAANCLCLMSRQGLDHHQLGIHFPLTELSMSFGFIRLRRRRNFLLIALLLFFVYQVSVCEWSMYVETGNALQIWGYSCFQSNKGSTLLNFHSGCFIFVYLYLCAFFYVHGYCLPCYLTCHLCLGLML